MDNETTPEPLQVECTKEEFAILRRNHWKYTTVNDKCIRITNSQSPSINLGGEPGGTHLARVQVVKATERGDEADEADEADEECREIVERLFVDQLR